MTFLAHETLHMSSLDPTNGMLCLGRAQDPLGGALGRPWGVLGGGVGHAKSQPWRVELHILLKTSDGRLLCQREPDIVEPVHQAMATERLDIK